MAETLPDIIKAGKLKPGTKLVHTWSPRSGEPDSVAQVVAGGLQAKGEVYSTPTAAAKAFNGWRATDGWSYWKLPNGQYLGSLRAGWVSPLDRSRAHPRARS